MTASGSWLANIVARPIFRRGPFSALKVRTPTLEVEKLFMVSFNSTVDRYKAMLANVDAGVVTPGFGGPSSGVLAGLGPFSFGGGLWLGNRRSGRGIRVHMRTLDQLEGFVSGVPGRRQN